jgi:hypothetical protein
MFISRDELNKIYNQHGFEILPDDAILQKGDYYNAVCNGLTPFCEDSNIFCGMMELTDNFGEPIKQCYRGTLYFIRPLPVKPKKTRKEPKVYYKVVKSDDLSSARAFSPVWYKLKKWIEAPKGTRLFLFDSLEAARNFANIGESIYTCQALYVAIGYGASNSYDKRSFWNFVAENSKGRHVTKAIAKANKLFEPTKYKAVLARRVKLLEKVG